MGKDKNLIKDLTTATEGYSIEVLKLASSQMSLTEKQATAVFKTKDLSGAELDAAVKAATLSASQKGATASTLGLSAAFKGLWATLMANPLLLVGAGITIY